MPLLLLLGCVSPPDAASDAAGDAANDSAVDSAVDSAGPPLPAQCADPVATVAYDEVGAARGLLDTTDTVGGAGVEGPVAFGDVDGDGDDDLVVYQRAVGTWLQRNTDGQLDATLLTAQPEVASLAWGDVDDDGDLDLVVTGSRKEVELLWNDGSGGFTATVLGQVDAPKRHAAFGDPDGDGDLDLFLTVGGGADQSDVLLANDGAGAFTRVDGAVPADPTGLGWSGTWSDLDGDGDPELYVANAEQALGSPSRLYRNDGGWRFTEVSENCGCSRTGASPMGGSVGDIDGDDRPDLFISNTGPNVLLLNQGDLSFVDVALAYGARVTETVNDMSYAGLWVDHDLDGRQDILVTTGPLHPPDDDLGQDPAQADVLLVRTDAGYEDRAPALGLDDRGVGRGAAWGLFDADGFPDLAVANLGTRTRLHVARCTEARALIVDLVGTRSNRFGVGAVVTVEAGGRRWTREVSAAAGWGSAVHPRVHVGLGERAPDRLRVRWPAGGEQVVELGPDTPLRVTVTEE